MQKRQSGEVGALRSPKKEVRGGHTCRGWVSTAEGSPESHRRPEESKSPGGSHLMAWALILSKTHLSVLGESFPT